MPRAASPLQIRSVARTLAPTFRPVQPRGFLQLFACVPSDRQEIGTDYLIGAADGHRTFFASVRIAPMH